MCTGWRAVEVDVCVCVVICNSYFSEHPIHFGVDGNLVKKKNNCANSFYEMLLFTWNERWTRFISEKKIIYIYENLLYSLLCSICVGFIWVFGFNSIKAFTSLLNRKIKVKSFRIAFFFFSSRLFYIYICKKQKANKKTKYYSFIANVWI